RTLSLRQESGPPISGYAELVNSFSPAVEVDQKEFIEEIQSAAYVASTSMANPVLTGIRVVAKSNALGIQSADGKSLFFQSAIKAQVTTPVEAILPSVDVGQILKN